jgi:eukaryotic-like serine/threonine-protein kinase
MMSSSPWSTPIDRFLALTLASGLLRTDDLQNALDDFGRDATVSADNDDALVTFCDYVIAHDILTQWQCDKLRNGQYKGFFLDGFKILDYTGTGESYSTFLAEDSATKRHVALIITPPALSPFKDGRIDYRVVEIDEIKGEK